jgi:hypothetical protein
MKTMKNHGQVNRCPGRVSQRAAPEHECRVTPLSQSALYAEAYTYSKTDWPTEPSVVT